MQLAHAVLTACLLVCAHACTNILVTPGASASGASFVSYNADSHTLYGALYHWPAGGHAPGTMRRIVDWDSGRPLGEIPEAAHTYNVVGNMNEFQLAITETTFGGVPGLQSQPQAKIDYGSLIYTTLSRARNAREAIRVMDELVTKYGYASEGESMSVVDKNEAWIFEIIGKGPDELGAVWVAVRLPDGTVSSHANQARIRTFPRNDPDNCMYAHDVVSFAVAKGLFPADRDPAEFSFSDVYDPVTFEGARFCEGRVWAIFSEFNPDMRAPYEDYATGHNLTNRMPLWITPSRKVELRQVMRLMGNHFEGTALEFDRDVGAGAFHLPYRWRPLTYDVAGATYVNERSAGTQQTGFSLVAQMRSALPDPVGGVLWFGVDDADSVVYCPFFASITEVPRAYATSTADMMTFSFDSAFFVFNMVTNFAYTRYDTIHPEVAKKIDHYQTILVEEAAALEAKVLPILNRPGGERLAVKILTEFSVEKGQWLVSEWLQYWKELFVRFMDGNIKTAAPGQYPPMSVGQPGYGAAWYERIVDETGDHYLETPAGASKMNAELSRNKVRLLNRR